MLKRHPIIIEPGKKYGKYTAIKVIKVINAAGYPESRWECIDDIGLTSIHRPGVLVLHNKVYQKAVIHSEMVVKNNQHQMGIRRRYYSEYKRNSQKRKIEFGLSFDQFNSLIIQSCYYCGAEPSYNERWKIMEHKIQPGLKHNGVDRISSSLGYTVENTVPCCSKCNLMKNVFDTENFLNHVYKICEFNKERFNDHPEREYTIS